MKKITEFKLLTTIGIVFMIFLNGLFVSFGLDSQYLGFSLLECGIVLYFYNLMLNKYFYFMEK
jgi:hypothetical protein